jgi:cytochrome bd-type quinol oxidase subunit 2
MTTAVATAATTTEPRTTPVWRTGARAGVLAAAATTGVAAVALAAGVPLEVDGEQIPLAGFAQLTLLCTVVGVLLAKALARWAARPQRTFTATAVALTGLSFVPDLVVSASSGTKLVLVATHVVAAALVIPALAARLPEPTR